ncbi:hypothetical protein PGQ11_013000 [Apiospora arundinis]|uniref:Uncharacterized protein n=1 Tax=Apiospora arundinis TaxID=335852 RepID=A0ABR2I4Q7_9PEZI
MYLRANAEEGGIADGYGDHGKCSSDVLCIKRRTEVRKVCGGDDGWWDTSPAEGGGGAAVIAVAVAVAVAVAGEE